MKEYIVSLRCVKSNDKSFPSNMKRDNDPIAQQTADANDIFYGLERNKSEEMSLS